MESQPETRKRTYIPPKLNKLTKEQATLILLGHATCGDQGAKDLLDVIYQTYEHDGSHGVLAHSKEERPAQVVSRTSWLIRRAFKSFQSTKEDFWRFVRG